MSELDSWGRSVDERAEARHERQETMSESKTPRIESPLCARTDGHRLIITVGINRLEGNEAHPTIPELQIKSPTMWVRDIITELEREDECGASLLTDLLDKAIQAALDNGSFAINEKAYDRAMKLRRSPEKEGAK